tara:strand:- start:2890 stop:3390 length:501 start_codon:yes stop_codon:yes gene_type:complete
MDKLIEEFSVGLFFWQTLLFLVLVFFLRKYAWKPILNAVEEREAGIKNALDSAEKAKKEMESLNADNERVLFEARKERDSMLKEARDMKNKIINEAKDSANIEAEKILLLAKEQITNEKMKAITELKNSVADLSIDMATMVIKSELKDKNKQKELVTASLKETELN